MSKPHDPYYTCEDCHRDICPYEGEDTLKVWGVMVCDMCLHAYQEGEYELDLDLSQSEVEDDEEEDGVEEEVDDDDEKVFLILPQSRIYQDFHGNFDNKRKFFTRPHSDLFSGQFIPLQGKYHCTINLQKKRV
jgi:hypothetical protein